jgi:ribonuclease P protein component
MLGRSHRFHGYGSLRRAYQGQTIRGSFMSLRFVARRPEKTYRIAVVVSRKVSKSAVVRNRIRRRVYEQVRLAKTVPLATDLVFTVFSEQVATLDSTKLQALIADLLEKAAHRRQKTV